MKLPSRSCFSMCFLSQAHRQPCKESMANHLLQIRLKLMLLEESKNLVIVRYKIQPTPIETVTKPHDQNGMFHNSSLAPSQSSTEMVSGE